MATMELFSHVVGVNLRLLTRQETALLEHDIVVRIYRELEYICKKRYRSFNCLIRASMEEEGIMVDMQLPCLLVKDILASGEYSIQGLAAYTSCHEDVIQEILVGRNTNPSALLLRRIIELHRFIRPQLYQSILNKVSADLFKKDDSPQSINKDPQGADEGLL